MRISGENNRMANKYKNIVNKIIDTTYKVQKRVVEVFCQFCKSLLIKSFCFVGPCFKTSSWETI